MVSLHVPAHNEPPDMVIDTLRALLRTTSTPAPTPTATTPSPAPSVTTTAPGTPSPSLTPAAPSP